MFAHALQPRLSRRCHGNVSLCSGEHNSSSRRKRDARLRWPRGNVWGRCPGGGAGGAMPRIPSTVLATAINYSRALTVSVTPGASSARLVWNTCMYIRNQRYVCVGMHAAAAEDQCQERSRERKPDLLNILRQSYGRYAVNIYSYYY